MTSTGIIFVASGDLYVSNAIRAANSVRRFHPDLPIHLFTDEEGIALVGLPTGKPFTTTSQIKNPHRRSKIECMANSPFDHTLYLDTDIKLAGEIEHLFKILEKYDIALCHEHRRSEAKMSVKWQFTLPNSFPQFNSGVVLFRKNSAMENFFRQWAENYHAAGIKQDQVTLRELLWISEVKLFVLPPEYNIRYLKYVLLWSPLEVVPRIYHLRRYHLNFWKNLWDPFRLLKNYVKYQLARWLSGIKK